MRECPPKMGIVYVTPMVLCARGNFGRGGWLWLRRRAQVRGTSCSPPTVRSAATVGCIDHKLQTVSVLQFLSHAATETHLPLRMHALALVNFL